MTHAEIVKWLRSKKVETGSLLCLGCGHENNCGIHGCAVIRAAADAIESLLDKLKYAEGERDVVTKHMIELEQEVGRLQKEA